MLPMWESWESNVHNKAGIQTVKTAFTLFHPAVFLSSPLSFRVSHFFWPISMLGPFLTLVWLFDMRANWQITGW